MLYMYIPISFVKHTVCNVYDNQKEKKNAEVRVAHSKNFRNAKKLKQPFYRNKKSKWEELRRAVNINPSGLGYRVAICKLLNI